MSTENKGFAGLVREWREEALLIMKECDAKSPIGEPCENCVRQAKGLDDAAIELESLHQDIVARVTALSAVKNRTCLLGDWEAIGYCRACDDFLALLEEK